jgi:hypothetical protein
MTWLSSGRKYSGNTAREEMRKARVPENKICLTASTHAYAIETPKCCDACEQWGPPGTKLQDGERRRQPAVPRGLRPVFIPNLALY